MKPSITRSGWTRRMARSNYPPPDKNNSARSESPISPTSPSEVHHEGTQLSLTLVVAAAPTTRTYAEAAIQTTTPPPPPRLRKVSRVMLWWLRPQLGRHFATNRRHSGRRGVPTPTPADVDLSNYKGDATTAQPGNCVVVHAVYTRHQLIVRHSASRSDFCTLTTHAPTAPPRTASVIHRIHAPATQCWLDGSVADIPMSVDNTLRAQT